MFIDHPDGYISIEGMVYPNDFWALVEPDFEHVSAGSTRIFESGVKHHIITNGKAVSQDIHDAIFTGYLAKKADYDAALAAHNDGAFIGNENGVIVIRQISDLSADKSELENDGADSATITADVADASFTGQITWRVIAPDGTESIETEAMSAGQATLLVTTTQEGSHSVSAEVVDYGSKQIEIQGV